MQTEMLSQIQNNDMRFVRTLGLILLVILPACSYSQAVDEQYLAGSAFLKNGDFQKAAESFSLAITRNNSSDQLYIKRGVAFLNLNQIDKAIADFFEANLINSQVADLWLARCYAANKEYIRAIEFLKSHLNSPFRLPEDSIKKDPSFDRLQDTPEWFSLWQKSWYSVTEKVIADAKYYASRKQYDRAVELLDEDLADTPGNPQLLIQRADVFMKQGNYIAAVADLSSVLGLDKALVSCYPLRAEAYLKSGRYKEAISDYNKAIREEPGDFSLYLKRAQAYAALSSWGPAIKDLQLYMKYFSNDLNALYQCGQYYYEAGDYMNALKSFNRNMKEDPNNANYYKARGKTYLKTATYRYAISDLSMSLDLNPSDAEAWMYHGVALIKSGNKSDGCSCLHKAQNLGSTEALKYIVENCN
jgi:tetratricopeptide (TPR) repeat protein